jgi:hypothetical protein
VARDKALSAWNFGEGTAVAGPWGSGYPGDPVTKKFLQVKKTAGTVPVMSINIF